MTSLTLRALAVGTLVLTVAGHAAAQAAPAEASPILNAMEVKKLVSSGNPADNARLAAHFTALAGRYAADAKRHTAMAQAFIQSNTAYAYERRG